MMFNAANDNFPNLNKLYGERRYVNPKFEAWEEWFAWYPIKMNRWVEINDMLDTHIKVCNYVWLKKILRRKVIDCRAGPGREFAGNKIYYEYTTTMDILKYGH